MTLRFVKLPMAHIILGQQAYISFRFGLKATWIFNNLQRISDTYRIDLRKKKKENEKKNTPNRIMCLGSQPKNKKRKKERNEQS